MTERPNRRRLDQINDLWEEDAPFSTDPDKIPQEQSSNYSKIAKYQRLWGEEQRRLRKLMHASESLRFRLTRLFRDGPLTQEDHDTIKQMGWDTPPEGRAMKGDLKLWVDTNPTMVETMVELGEQNDVVETLVDIIATLQQRNISLAVAAKQGRFAMGSD